MPSRILCCSGSLDTGGSERQLWQLATRLPPERFAAEVFLLYRRGDLLARLPKNIPVHDFWSEHAEPRFWWPGQIHRQQVLHLVDLIRQRTIGLVYDRTFHMTLLTAAACRQTLTPRVSVIVSPPSQDFARSRERFRWLKKRLLARAYRDPRSTLLTVSASVTQDAARFYGLDQSRILTLPSPIDGPAIEQAAAEHPTCEKFRVLQQSDNQTLRVVVVGRLTAEKGQALAIEAVAKLRSMRPEQAILLSIVGAGSELDALERLTDRLGVQSNVQFVGATANPFPWMKCSDLLCIPSQYEGLPNVALEAMSLRTPVVATHCSGSLRELLGKDERGQLTPLDDPQSLASAWLDRLDHPQAWEQRVVAAAAWVRRHHGLQSWLERMQEIFDERIQIGTCP